MQKRFKTGEPVDSIHNYRAVKDEPMFSVWIGGAEVNDTALLLEQAKDLAIEYIKNGYDDVVIEINTERER